MCLDILEKERVITYRENDRDFLLEIRNGKYLNEFGMPTKEFMDIVDEYSFKYFMDYIIKRLSGLEDAHTKYQIVDPIPFNFRKFNDDILVNYPDDLKETLSKILLFITSSGYNSSAFEAKNIFASIVLDTRKIFSFSTLIYL